mmetsp:Transcript_24054/g.34478  ORF Transcript_24054/g.34478 Transcript_24054/m.34478 type:complete len:511 (+) Transcript_24054:123-1655(+)
MLRPSARGSKGTVENAAFREVEDNTKRRKHRHHGSIVTWVFYGFSLCLLILLCWTKMKSSSKYHRKNPYISLKETKEDNFPEKQSDLSVAENKKNKFIQPPEFDTDGTTRIHVVFSTDCSDYQHWQSYAVFYSAMKIGQSGKVTRIASGCSDTQAKEVTQWHKEHIQIPMSDNFLLHLTPDFKSVKTEDGKKAGKYDYFNKPFGLLHWLENGESMGIDPSTKRLTNENVVIVLIDPDMILLRPFSSDFSNKQETLFNVENEEWVTKVQHGKPFASKYGLGTDWRRFNLTEIAGTNSPSKQVDEKDAEYHYAVGPPYLATGRDMYAIAKKWADFAPRVHREFPYLLAEMYAFCIAAAHLNLPHKLVKSLMISSWDCDFEGWLFIDRLSGNDACRLAQSPNHEENPVPNVIHYCQTYHVGDWFFSKYKFASNFFSCECPLLETPPSTIGIINYVTKRNGTRVHIKEKQSKRDAFMLCGIISLFNEAANLFKTTKCESYIFTAYDKTLRYFVG